MNRAPTSMKDADLQHLLLMRADDLRHFVVKKIPARFRSLIAAEDVLQEVWISAFRAYTDFRPEEPGAFDHWLKAIANRRLADAIRAARALKRGGSGPIFHGDPAQSASWADLFAHITARDKTPSGEMSQQEAANALQIALGSLAEPRRRAVYLRCIEGRSRSEVAQTMQRSDAAISSLIRAGLRELRQRLRHASRFFSDTRSSADHGLETGAASDTSA